MYKNTLGVDDETLDQALAATGSSYRMPTTQPQPLAQQSAMQQQPTAAAPMTSSATQTQPMAPPVQQATDAEKPPAAMPTASEMGPPDDSGKRKQGQGGLSVQSLLALFGLVLTALALG